MKNKKLKYIVKKFLPYYNRYIGGNLKYYIESLILLVITNAIGVIHPILIKIIIDDALIGKNFQLLIILLAIIAITSIVLNILSGFGRYIFDFIIGKINFKANTDFYYHILKLPISFYNKKRVGEILTRMQDSNVVHSFVNILLFDICNNLLLILMNFIVCFYISPIITLIVLIFLPFFLGYNLIISKISRKREKQKWYKEQQISSEVNESLFGIRIIKNFVAELKIFRKVKLMILKLREFNLRYDRIFLFFDFIYSFFNSVENFLIFCVSGILIINGKMTIGEWTAIQVLISRIFSPMKSLLFVNQKIQKEIVTLDRFYYISNLGEEKHVFNNNLNIKDGKIVFDNVSFGYYKNKYVLKNVNLKIEKGKAIGLIGKSGAGKTTIINLIAKYFIPSSGKILIDGVDLANYDVRTLRNDIGMVEQNPYLFYGTILDNLLIASSEKDKNKIIEACKIANAHEFIMALPNGYNTIIGEKGVRLSVGEKQRIAIAQAILKDPKILIFDEPTSNLDLITEEKIQEALFCLIKNRTSIIIAHRLSTIKKVDTIYVVEDGKIIESGSHKSLIKKESYYRELYRKTAKI